MRQWFKQLFCFHHWDDYMYNLRADDEPTVIMVVSWKQCHKCAKSKFNWILT